MTRFLLKDENWLRMVQHIAPRPNMPLGVEKDPAARGSIGSLVVQAKLAEPLQVWSMVLDTAPSPVYAGAAAVGERPLCSSFSWKSQNCKLNANSLGHLYGMV